MLRTPGLKFAALATQGQTVIRQTPKRLRCEVSTVVAGAIAATP